MTNDPSYRFPLRVIGASWSATEGDIMSHCQVARKSAAMNGSSDFYKRHRNRLHEVRLLWDQGHLPSRSIANRRPRLNPALNGHCLD